VKATQSASKPGRLPPLSPEAGVAKRPVDISSPQRKRLHSFSQVLERPPHQARTRSTDRLFDLPVRAERSAEDKPRTIVHLASVAASNFSGAGTTTGLSELHTRLAQQHLEETVKDPGGISMMSVMPGWQQKKTGRCEDDDSLHSQSTTRSESPPESMLASGAQPRSDASASSCQALKETINKKPSKRRSCESIRLQAETALTTSITVDEKIATYRVVPVMRCCGILPWDLSHHHGRWIRPSLWYQWFMLLLGVGYCVDIVHRAVTGSDGWFWEVGRHPLQPAKHWWDYLPTMVLGASVVLGYVSLNTFMGSGELARTNMIILAYMRNRGHLNEWKGRMIVQSMQTVCVWLLVVGLSIGAGSFTAGFAVITFMYSGLVHGVLYICFALTGLLDLFGNMLIQQERILDAVTEWRDLQAVLRKSSSCIEWCLFILQFTAVAQVVTVALDLMSGHKTIWEIAPFLVLAARSVLALFRAAQVTDKCTRMPSLLNLFFTVEMDRELEYVVNYVQNSMAGFYVFEVRVTSAIALKLVYLCGVLVLALAAPGRQ